MRKKLIEISYIFEEENNTVPKYGFNLISTFSIEKNFILKYFRVEPDFLNYDLLKKYKFTLHYEKNRNDITFICFNTLDDPREFNRFLEKNVFEYPAELDFLNLNCTCEYFIDNLTGVSLKKSIIEHHLEHSFSIYENVITIKFNHDFYNNNHEDIESKMIQWENSIKSLKFRKSIK